MRNIKFLYFILFILMSLPLNAQRLLEEDKQFHYVATGLFAVPTYYFTVEQLNLTPSEGVIVTTALGALGSWGFEHLQKTTGNGVYDKYDILAGTVGAFTGAMFAEVIRYKPSSYKQRMLRKQKRKEKRLRKKLTKHEN